MIFDTLLLPQLGVSTMSLEVEHIFNGAYYVVISQLSLGLVITVINSRTNQISDWSIRGQPTRGLENSWTMHRTTRGLVKQHSFK